VKLIDDDQPLLADVLAAEARPLDASELAELESIVPAEAIAGTRYGAQQMADLDSER
ncbi:MAG: hypothetical protein IAG13_25365, partial [Deltaproteobacteria bacterium]|nr:hypothetical protein [Nannocystaceae bacterium]